MSWIRLRSADFTSGITLGQGDCGLWSCWLEEEIAAVFFFMKFRLAADWNRDASWFDDSITLLGLFSPVS